jgi:hypothetical protein
MKNIHILPTDKPSRLYLIKDKLKLSPLKFTNDEEVGWLTQNIYITSDEEINQQTKPCWCINTIKNTWSKDLIYYQGAMPQYHFVGFKKIILTTDQDLIKDDIQAIDDKFLEWFVKNSSCEEVEVVLDEDIDFDNNKWIDSYHIIIPKEEFKCTCKEHDPYCCQIHGSCPTCVKKEEPKPHSFCETPKERCTMRYCDENGCLNRKRNLVEIQPQQIWNEEKMKGLKSLIDMMKDDEELGLYEEPENHVKYINDNINVFDKSLKEAFEKWGEVQESYDKFDVLRFGAWWQQERSYSEEDIKTAFKVGFSIGYGSDVHAIDEKNKTCKQWFKQFKKK